jgi:hypothetical protein
MWKQFKYTSYIVDGRYFNIRQYRPRNRNAREVYYFLMIFPISFWIVIASSFLTVTIPVDIFRILKGLQVKIIRNNLKNKRMKGIIEEQQKIINSNNQEIEALLTSKQCTKADLHKLIDIIENTNNNAIFVTAFLRSVIKDM